MGKRHSHGTQYQQYPFCCNDKSEHNFCLFCLVRLFVEKLPAHPEYNKVAPVDKINNKKVLLKMKEKKEWKKISNFKEGSEHPACNGP